MIKGNLKFTSWYSLILIDETNIKEILEEFFNKNNGKKMKQEEEMNNYTLQTGNYDMVLDYKKDKYYLLKNTKQFGFSNLNAYIESFLRKVNGREIIVNISDDCFKISANSGDKVYALNYTSDNECAITEQIAKTICKLGEGNECCIFLTLSDKFYCSKFSSFTARELLDRLEKGKMYSKRIGDCKIIGREENTVNG